MHKPKILNQEKTQTRRRISRFKKGPKKGKVVPPYKVGSVQPCQTSMFSKPFAYVRILRRWVERLGDISVQDAYAEGGYAPQEYVSLVIDMYDDAIDANEVLWCYEFQVI